MSPHQPRSYRRTVGSDDLVAFQVVIAETDLMVSARRPLRVEARSAAREARRQIESHALLRPEFLSARSPLTPDPAAPEICGQMYRAARLADTGPMAAVAGAIAESVARALLPHSPEVIVENGGDLFLISGRERLVAVRAGRSPLDRKFALVVPPGEMAVCTSSGTVGHSASAGRADAVVIAAEGGACADALATATANRVSSAEQMQAALQWARERGPVRQVLIICEGAMAAWGEMQLRRVAANE